MTTNLFRILAALSVVFCALPATASSVLDLTQTIESHSYRSEGVAVSPDGEFVYVAVQRNTEGIAVFARDTTTEELTPLQLIENGTGGITAMEDPEFLTVTPDGLGVVMTSRNNDALIAFRRDVGTGLLTFANELVDGVGGVAMDFPREVAVSPDSKHVYVAAYQDAAIAIFSRDLVTGVTTFVESESSTGPSGMHSVQSVVVSPDGGHLYAGAITAFQHYSRNATTGELTHVQEYSGVDHVRLSRFDPSGSNLYVLEDGRIWTFDHDVPTGALSVVGSDNFTLGSPDADDARSLAVFSGYVYVAADGTSPSAPAILRWTRDGGTGGLSSRTQVGTDPEFWYPNYQGYFVAPSDENALIAVANNYQEQIDLVRSYVIDPGTGDLTLTSLGSFGPIGSQIVRSGVLSPGGTHFYTVSAGRVSALTAYDRNTTTGDLTLLEEHIEFFFGPGLAEPTSIAISPDGLHLYVSDDVDDTVTVLTRDPGTGLATFSSQIQDGVGGVDGIDGAEQIIVSPDGLHAYVAGRGERALASFTRDGATGALTPLEVHFDFDPGIDGLSAPTDVTLSPDGSTLYVVASGDDAVSVWDRDPTTGLVLLAELQRDGVAGVTGMSGPARAAVSPDGAHVYVSATDTIAQFTRDLVTGSLTFQRSYEAGVDGWAEHGLGHYQQGPHVSPDGEHLYIGLTTASRDPVSGDLSFVAYDEDGGGYLAVSADSQFVYGNLSLDMETYDRGFSGCDPAPLTGCDTAAKTKLTLKDSATVPKKQKLVWSWINGPPTDIVDFDPMGVKHYGFCLYAESGPTPELVFEALIPAGGDCRKNNASFAKDCWSVASSKVKYADSWLSPDGILQAQFFPHLAPKSRIKIKGKGADLPLDGLPFGLPLRAQVQDAAGGCWEALYGTATKNDGTTFKAKTP